MNARVLKMIFFSNLLFLVCCGSATKAKAPPAEVKKDGIPLVGPKGSEPIVTTGISNQLFLAPDNRLFYAAEGRFSHAQNQIYSRATEAKENSKTEKRWTYAVGSCETPAVSLDNKHLIYSCDSDETTETPSPLRGNKSLDIEVNWPFAKVLPSSEIYTQEFTTREVTRLTTHPGYDGHPRFIGPTNDFVFSSWINKSPQILRYRFKNKSSEVLFPHPSNQIQPTADAKGEKIVWVRFETGKTNSEILVGDLKSKKAEPLALPVGLYLHPTFSEDSKFIILSVKPAGALYFQIMAWDTSKSCLIKWAEADADLSFPQVSDDLKTLYMSVQVLKQSQIFKLSKDFASLTCNK